jgi:phosphatidylserine/phosphatidylglycerophosphate/cardiolipin synthase-like enzyme
VDALRDQIERVEVRIILRRLPGSRKVLEALQARGFPMKVGDEPVIKLQPNCHNKGMIVDSEVVLLGSHNWSSPGTTQNRDASLIIHNAEIARYYERIFDHDWRSLARARVIDGSTMPIVADGSLRSRRLDEGTGVRGSVLSFRDFYED